MQKGENTGLIIQFDKNIDSTCFIESASNCVKQAYNEKLEIGKNKDYISDKFGIFNVLRLEKNNFYVKKV